MLRAIFFDFNGVIVGDEPLHFKLFQKTLAQIKIPLTQKDYYEKYLGYDDYDCFSAVLKDAGSTPDDHLIAQLTQTKTAFYAQEIEKQDLFIPDVIHFVKKVSEKYLLGVVSGALRHEIEAWLHRGDIYSCFETIVAAEDMTHGKPDPEGYYRGLTLLNRDCVQDSAILLPQECLVIEDSLWGIESAHAAGMKCLALTTSYPKEALNKADWVASEYKEIQFEEIEKAFDLL